MRVIGGEPLWLVNHLARLKTGADVLGIPVPFDDAAVAAGIRALLAAKKLKEASVRLMLTRGPSKARGLWPPAAPPKPTMIAIASKFTGAQRSPVKLIVATTVRRNEHSPLSRVKSLNYGDNIIARREAEACEADDALLVNSVGRVVCSTVGNIFARIDGEWRTPPIADGILAGTARRHLIPMIKAREISLTLDDLARADAVFLSNSLSLLSVSEIEEKAFEDITPFLTELRLFKA
jgi:branched-chain amino acid aminotransferase